MLSTDNDLTCTVLNEECRWQINQKSRLKGIYILNIRELEVLILTLYYFCWKLVDIQRQQHRWNTERCSEKLWRKGHHCTIVLCDPVLLLPNDRATPLSLKYCHNLLFYETTIFFSLKWLFSISRVLYDGRLRMRPLIRNVYILLDVL